MAQMKCGVTPLTAFNIPQDIQDAADKLKLDAVTLVSLCVEHGKEAVRGILSKLADLIPG